MKKLITAVAFIAFSTTSLAKPCTDEDAGIGQPAVDQRSPTGYLWETRDKRSD